MSKTRLRCRVEDAPSVSRRRRAFDRIQNICEVTGGRSLYKRPLTEVRALAAHAGGVISDALQPLGLKSAYGIHPDGAPDSS